MFLPGKLLKSYPQEWQHVLKTYFKNTQVRCDSFRIEISFESLGRLPFRFAFQSSFQSSLESLLGTTGGIVWSLWNGGFIFKACYSNSWRRRCCHDRCRREFTQTPRKKVKKKRRRKCGGCKIGVVERRWRGCSRETLKKKSRRIIWRILTDPLPKRRRRRNDKDKEHRKEANTTFKTGSASWEYNSLLSRCPKRNINIWDQVLIWKKRLGRGDPGINSLDGIDKQHDNN